MKILARLVLSVAVVSIIAVASNTAYADGIILVTPQIEKLVPPMAALNLQHHGNNTTEQGGVRWDGTQDVWFGDTSAGPHQNTILFSSLGVQDPEPALGPNQHQRSQWRQQDADHDRVADHHRLRQ